MIETLYPQTSTPANCERLELEVVFSELFNGIPAELTFTTLKMLPNGQHLPCAQTVQVLDAGLLQRIACLRSGDKIRVTIETDWTSPDILAVLKACTQVV